MKEIGHSEFLEILRGEFPSLRENFELYEGDDNPHIEMSEFRRFMEKAVASGDWTLVARCLAVLDRIFKAADHTVKNAVYVSFLEQVDLSTPPGDRLRALMSPELLQGYVDINEYLIRLGVPNKSYRPLSP